MSYLLFFLGVIILSYLGRERKVSYFLLFVLCVFFLGFRQNVGTDYQNYVHYFEMGDVIFFEPANQLIYYFAVFLGDEVKWTFFIYALCSYVFLFLALKDCKNPVVYIFLIISTFTFLTNGIRQAAAIMIFFYACRYIYLRKIVPYILYILLAFMFHTSIIIVMPLYFIINKSFSSKYYICAYLLSLVFTQFDLAQIAAPFESIISIVPKYSGYIENRTEGYFSLGVLLELLLYIFLFSLSLKHKFHNRYPILFNLFFFAAIFFNMRIGAYIINRVVIIFAIFRHVIAAMLISDKLYCDRYRQINSLIIILVYIIFLCQAIYFDEKNYMTPYQNILL